MGIPDCDTLSESLRESVDYLVSCVLLSTVEHDERKEVVATACECLTRLCHALGSPAVHNFLDDVVRHMCDLVAGSATCQEVESDDGDEEGHQDHDNGRTGHSHESSNGHDILAV